NEPRHRREPSEARNRQNLCLRTSARSVGAFGARFALRQNRCQIPRPSGLTEQNHGGCADSAITLKLFFDFRRYQRGNIQASDAQSDAPCISYFAVRKHNHSKFIIHESPNERRETRQSPAVRNCSMSWSWPQIPAKAIIVGRSVVKSHRCPHLIEAALLQQNFRT